MPQGPAGVDRPFVSTNLKYDVRVQVDEDIYRNPPKAIDLIDMRVNAPQVDSNKFIQDKIGKIILAVNGLAHPSRHRVVNEELNKSRNIPEGKVEIVWTYIVDGSGIGEARNTRTYAKDVKDLYTVLVEENDQPIKRSSKQREWNPSPYSVQKIELSTE